MTHIFSWLLILLLLSGVAILLRQAMQNYALSFVIARRLRTQISPHLAGPWLAAQAHAALEWLGRRLAGARPVLELQGQMLRAGFLQPSAPYLFTGLRAVLMALAMAAIILWGSARGMTPARLAAAPFGAFLVYRLSLGWLALRAAARQRAIRRELPYVLDLILMVLDSGVSIDQALAHVGGQIGRAAPISAAILKRYIAETEDGVPYDMALDRMGQRLAVNEGRDFAGLLKQNLFQGGELGAPLHRLAADISDARLAAAREEMGRKSVLLTLIMLAFFMPVLMIALAGPAVSDLSGALKHVAADLQHTRGKK